MTAAVVRVEFFGVPRARAGVAETTAVGSTLGDLLDDLRERFPEFAGECLAADGSLQPTCIANRNGTEFVRDRTTPLPPGSCVLILSADAGG